MEHIDPRQAEEAVRSGIRYQEYGDIEVCGNKCPERDQVASELRGLEVSVDQQRCLGGCSLAPLLEGSYALIPRETGGRMTVARVVILPGSK